MGHHLFILLSPFYIINPHTFTFLSLLQPSRCGSPISYYYKHHKSLYTYTYTLYIYIYSMCVCIYTYIYTHIYVYTNAYGLYTSESGIPHFNINKRHSDNVNEIEWTNYEVIEMWEIVDVRMYESSQGGSLPLSSCQPLPFEDVGPVLQNGLFFFS